MSVDFPNSDRIRQAAEAYEIRLLQHTLLASATRKIFFEDIRNILINGEVIETRFDDPRGPKCLMVGMIRGDIPLYLSVSYDEEAEQARVITVHWQDPGKWLDYRTRKPKAKNPKAKN